MRIERPNSSTSSRASMKSRARIRSFAMRAAWWSSARADLVCLGSALGGRRRDDDLLVPLQELQPMLELRDAKLELLVLRTENEPQLAQHSLQPGTGTLGDAGRVAAPPGDEVVDGGARFVTLHSPALDERVDEVLDAFGGQGHRSHAREEQLLEQIARVFSGLGHAASSVVA